jgi:hypothetical protein
LPEAFPQITPDLTVNVRTAVSGGVNDDSYYLVLDVDLSVAHTDLALSLGGHAFRHLTVLAAPAAFDIKLNGTGMNPIPAEKGLAIGPLYITAVYVTNTVGAGTARILLTRPSNY